MSRRQYLLDLNCLIALADPTHSHYRAIHRWFDESRLGDWGICPLTESGFVRVTTNASYGPKARTIAEATKVLRGFSDSPGYRYWPIESSWAVLTAPFADRIFGHQQVTDAYLLGLAMKADGVLVTFDKGIRYMAGAEYGRHVLLLE